MKNESKRIPILCCSMFLISGCVVPFKGTTVVSPRFDSARPSISVMYEAPVPTSQVWFMSSLHRALMENGYKVTERLHYPEVLHELRDDGIVEGANKTSGGSLQAFSTASNYGFTPPEIKKIGIKYGLDYLAIFTHMKDTTACLRLIDCKTAEVVSTSQFSALPLRASRVSGDAIAQLLIRSLRCAAKQTDTNGLPVTVYLDISNKKRIEGTNSGSQKILYQKKITNSANAPYGLIYMLSDY